MGRREKRGRGNFGKREWEDENREGEEHLEKEAGKARKKRKEC